MPIVVTTDLTDVNLSEATTGYATLGTWATTIAASPDTYVQSANTVGGRVSANTGWAHSNIPTTTVDLTINERHVFQWLKCISIPQLDSKANGGLAVTISSDATPTLTGTTPNNGPTNSKSWWVGGNADATAGWVCYVVDPQGTPDLTLGTPTLTAIRRIGIRGKVVGTVGAGAIRPVNIVFDATRYGTGDIYQGIDGTTPGTFFDIVNVDMNNVANAWGVLTFDSSIYFGAGKLTFGTSGQSTITSFKDVNQLFVWRNFPVAPTFYAFNLIGNATYSTTFQLGDYTAGLASGGCTIKGAGDTAGSTFAIWTLSVGTNSICKIYASALSELRRATLASTTEIIGCNFQNFGDITANGATIKDCTFQGLRNTAPISATYGISVTGSAAMLSGNMYINCATAVLWNVNVNPLTYLIGSDFISGGTGHGIELGSNTPVSIDFQNMSFSGYGANGTTNAALYNNSGKTITIYLSGTGSAPSVRNGTGADTIIISAKSFRFNLSPAITGYEWRIYSVTSLGSLAGAVELAGQETATLSSQTYAYNYTANQPIAVQILSHPGVHDYIESVTYYTLGNNDQEVTIILQEDINN